MYFQLKIFIFLFMSSTLALGEALPSLKTFQIQKGLNLMVESLDSQESDIEVQASNGISRLNFDPNDFNLKISTTSWTYPETVEFQVKTQGAIAGINAGFFHTGDTWTIMKAAYTQNNFMARTLTPFFAPAALLVKENHLINDVSTYSSVVGWRESDNKVISGQIKVSWFLDVQGKEYKLSSKFYNYSNRYSVIIDDKNYVILLEDGNLVGFFHYDEFLDEPIVLFVDKKTTSHEILDFYIELVSQIDQDGSYQSLYQNESPSIFLLKGEALLLGIFSLDEFRDSFKFQKDKPFLKHKYVSSEEDLVSDEWASMDYIITGSPVLISNGVPNSDFSEKDFPDSPLRKAYACVVSTACAANNYVLKLTKNFILKYSFLYSAVDDEEDTDIAAPNAQTERTTICFTGESKWILSRYGKYSHVSTSELRLDHEKLGCVHAIVLDGGPSSEMFINISELNGEPFSKGLKIGNGRVLIDSLLIFEKNK